MIDLQANGVLKQLAKQIKSEIDNYCVAKYDEGPRSHLGASEIGHNCSRYLWYKFRWIAHKTHDGRQYRLFQRGHFEEPRFVQYLEGIGFQVQMFAKALWYHPESSSYFIDDVDMQDIRKDGDAQLCINVTGDMDHFIPAQNQGAVFDKAKAQIRISACRGHFGGSVDGIAYREDTGKMLTEFKTNGTGKGFTELTMNGCQLKKHQHFSQQSIYGYKLGLTHSIYMVVNKNDDDLYIEVVPLDWKLGAELEKKAEMIIFSEEPPSKLSQSASYYECSWCDLIDVCHNGKCAEKNCRSCKFAFPVDNAEWLCTKWNANIPKEAIAVGCDEWIPIV